MTSPNFDEVYAQPDVAPLTSSMIPQEIQNLLSEQILKKNMRVLEIGCGEGYASVFLAKHGVHVTAIDSSANAILFAKNNAQKEGVDVHFERGNYLFIGQMKERFDFIFDWRFLHEIIEEEKRERYLRSITQLLGPKGKYLSVAFSGDSQFMGVEKIRVSPVGIPLYFATLEESKKFFGKYFNIIYAKHITVPQKPNLQILANYLLCERP